MGKSTISMAIFNSYVELPEGNPKSLKHVEALLPLQTFLRSLELFFGTSAGTIYDSPQLEDFDASDPTHAANKVLKLRQTDFTWSPG